MAISLYLESAALNSELYYHEYNVMRQYKNFTINLVMKPN
jgi:hypothetical protein